MEPSKSDTKLKLEIGDYIIISNKYLGKILTKIWNGNGFIVKLENSKDYVDSMITQYKLLGDNPSNGYMLVTLSDNIKPLDPNNLFEIISDYTGKRELGPQINNLILKNFDDLIRNKLSSTMIPITQQKIDSVDLIGTPGIKMNSNSIISNDKLVKYKLEDINEDNYVKYIIKLIQELFVPNDKIMYEEDVFALKNMDSISINVLSEENINQTIKPEFKKILERYDKINMDYYYDYKNTLMFRHLITDEDFDTLSLGKQLITRIKKILFDIQKDIDVDDGIPLIDEVNLFDFIRFRIVGGYVEMINKFADEKDFRVLDEELLPGLTAFSSMYSNPIDYKILTDFIFQIKTKEDFESNKDKLKEAVNILSQEYVLCLQPKVEFLLWTISRLIVCWYSDQYLFNNIYKIKVLINLYRARGLKEFNQDIGVQPVIMIIPRYGKDISTKILSHLSFYFFPYKRIGWKESNPTYFNRLDDLLHYTNGSIEIKKYLKLIKRQDKHKLFSKDLTKVNTGTTDNDLEFNMGDSLIKAKKQEEAEKLILPKLET